MSISVELRCPLEASAGNILEFRTRHTFIVIVQYFSASSHNEDKNVHLFHYRQKI